MKKLSLLLLLTACPLLLSQCNLFKKEDLPPLEQLPPATQEGKNTVGFLLNWQAWTPKGYNGTSNYSLDYDPTYDEGNFDLRTYRYLSDNPQNPNQQYLILSSNHLASTGTYSFKNKLKTRVSFYNDETNCEYHSVDSLHTDITGNLIITKFDLSKGIISGTFEFTLVKHGCDTIKVTNGRFDKKL